MSRGMHGWSARRHVPAGVSSLEVWNLPVLGQELWKLLGAGRVETDRRAGVPESMLAFHLLPVLAGALAELVPRHAPDAVWLSGGLACLEGFEPLMEQVTSVLGCPVYVAEDPRFAPVRAGLRLLEPLRPASPVALDVGQTSIKCASPATLRVLVRDTAVLPLRFIGMPRPKEGHVPAAVRFIGSALRTFVRQEGSLPPDTRSHVALPDARGEATPGAASSALRSAAQGGRGTPDALCLALPCPVDGTLIPGGCTYGWEGHASLVEDLLRTAELPCPSGGGTMLVLNDAELAAEAARWDERLAAHKRVLCLTLGFGPGGALLVRD